MLATRTQSFKSRSSANRFLGARSRASLPRGALHPAWRRDTARRGHRRSADRIRSASATRRRLVHTYLHPVARYAIRFASYAIELLNRRQTPNPNELE